MYHSTYSDDYLRSGKQNRKKLTHPNTKFLHTFRGRNNNNFFSDQSNDISKTTTFSKVFKIFVHIASLRRESKELKINYLILTSETEKKDV